MKHKHSHHNTPSTSPQLMPICFEFTHPTASTVSVAGTFNDWHPTAKPMHPLGNGHWMEVTVLAPGSYEYCLVVDGEWISDPLARSSKPNPFGGKNSVLEVGNSPEAARIAVAKSEPLRNPSKPKPQKPYPNNCAAAA